MENGLCQPGIRTAPLVSGLAEELVLLGYPATSATAQMQFAARVSYTSHYFAAGAGPRRR